MKYETVIGLEFHVKLKTKTKMFCGCSNSAENVAPNTNICPICLGHPGTLPVVNKNAMKLAMKAALALNCKINTFTKFDRKHYFYPDLPKGYQISQYDKPLGEHGYFDINFKAADGLAGRLDDKDQLKRIEFVRLHVEEDAAKNTHAAGDSSLVDYNRGGAPLAEIVTGTQLSSPHQAKTLAQEIQLLMRQLDVSYADMEKGQMRCDANISLRPEGDHKLYPKTEIKNLNSFKAIEKALEYEEKRQKLLWEDGKTPEGQETRGWNEDKLETYSQRVKEGEADYRYFPEPDIPPLEYTDEEIEIVKNNLGELPQQKRYRFMDIYGFTPAETKIITHDKDLANYSEQVISELKEWLSTLEGVEGTPEEIWTNNKKKIVKLTANWLINRLITKLSDKDISFSELKITAENFSEFITLVYLNKVNSTNAQKILDIMIENGQDPSHIMAEHDFSQVDDDDTINKIIENVIKNFPEQVAQYKAGKETIIKFLLGQVMKQSKGKANPTSAEELLKKSLQ